MGVFGTEIIFMISLMLVIPIQRPFEQFSKKLPALHLLNTATNITNNLYFNKVLNINAKSYFLKQEQLQIVNRFREDSEC